MVNITNEFGYFVPTSYLGHWIFVHTKSKICILIASRSGTKPWISTKDISNLINKLEEIFIFKNLNIIIRLRGIFLDDKNGNVGSCHVDIYQYENMHDKIANESTKLFFQTTLHEMLDSFSEIHSETNDEFGAGIFLHMNYSIKKCSESDHWNIDGDYEYKEAKENIFWK
jgi:hypothetical protein